jgi:hypothetical protein
MRAAFIAVTLLCAASTIARAEPILIDDFDDGVDDGWSKHDGLLFRESPGGPAVMDVNGKGEYRFATGGVVPKTARARGPLFFHVGRVHGPSL